METVAKSTAPPSVEKQTEVEIELTITGQLSSEASTSRISSEPTRYSRFRKWLKPPMELLDEELLDELGE